MEHCYECHSEKAGKRKGDLLLDRPSGWLEGGQSGPAVVPGKINDSLLSLAISHEDEDMAMPKEKLPQGMINVLNRWIQMGAPGPRKVLKDSEFSQLGDQDFLFQKAKTHWSFQPVKRPQLPKAAEGESKNPIDLLVNAKLKEKGLQLAEPANKRTLLRRLSYDLTGLPPTKAEVDAFVSNKSPKAYLKQVDRLLASPHFGERWGRYWLDVARYADTREWQAAGIDSRYPFAYTYRDYVIRAYNEDLPYDQFLKQQIAADFYTEKKDDPSLAALGFLTVGSRFRNNEDEIANDRIDVVTRGIMGLTVACARCHDHKYDPIPTADYYALHSVFRSVKDIENYPTIETDIDLSPEQISDYQKKRAKALKEKTDYQNDLAKKARAEFRKRPGDYLSAIYDMSIARKETVQKLISGGKYSESVLTPIGAKIARIPIEKKYLRDPFWGAVAHLVKKPEKQFPSALAQFLANEKQKIHPVVKTSLKENSPKNGKELLELYGSVFKTAFATPEANGAILQHVNDEKGLCYIAPKEALNATRIQGKGRRKIADLDNLVRNLDAEHRAAPPRAMVVEEAAIWPARIYNRGDRANRGDLVDRKFLSVFGGAPLAEKKSGRKEIAEEIASANNSFTTRTAVDRIWRSLFGKSLIPSSGDMGLQAGEPSNPELLDFLAADFVANGWSNKKLIRKIVLSATYRQSSDFRPEAAKVDPENKLYWRQELRRLDFEAMRDSILTAAGNLDLTAGGRAVEITSPPYTNRRTVYAYIDRVNLDDLFATFDFPSPMQSVTERPQTLVPQQALYGMNDGFVIAQARLLSRQLQNIKEGKVRVERIKRLYHQIYQRDPDPDELRMANQFIDLAIEGQEVKNQSAWQYGYGDPAPNTPPEQRFTEFPYYSAADQAYRFAKAFPHPKWRFLDVSRIGGHTGKSPAISPIRRWTAPYAGKFKIDTEIVHMREGGDGIRAHIISDKKGHLKNVEMHNETKRLSIAEIQLEAGEVLDFIVDCKSNPSSDSFRQTVNIDWLRGENMYPEAGTITSWDSQGDFTSPPPPPLNGWEQMAHALFMTNEFLYIE